MLPTIDPMMAGGVFLASFILDAVYTKYVEFVAEHRAEAAAIICLFWHAISAGMVFAYAQNGIYIVFVTLGGTLGTYVSICIRRWMMRRREATTGLSGGPAVTPTR